MTHGYEWFLEYDYVDMDDFDFEGWGEFDDFEDVDDEISNAWSELERIYDEVEQGDSEYDF